MTPQPKEQSHSALPIPVELFDLQVYEADREGKLPNRVLAEIVTTEWGYQDECLSAPEAYKFAAYLRDAVNSHARLLAQNEMLRKALESIVEAANLETVVAGTHKRSEAQALIAKASAAIQQTENV